MSYPPLPSNGQTNWGDNFRAWADALEGRKVEGEGMSLRYDTSVGERVFLDRPGGSTMLWGETGWRDITSMCEGIESGTVLIRRTTTDVQWQFRSAMLSPGSGNLTISSTTPFGWRPVNTTVTSTVARAFSHAHLQNFTIQGSHLIWLSETMVIGAAETTTTRPNGAISGIITGASSGWPTAQIGTPA